MFKPVLWNLRLENSCLFIDNGLGRVVLQHNARQGMRPYIHPLHGPDGQVCLTEDSPWHHPWQHGIQTGFHGVNGCDFWFDPGQRVDQKIGTIEPVVPRILSTAPPQWEIEAVWRHEDGSFILIEKQKWSIRSVENLIYLDLDWKLQAILDVQIDQGPYGGLFVRMPYRKERGAKVMNSEGLVDDCCEQQAAAWVDLVMPFDIDSAGISFFDHPCNPTHPTHWRIDNQRGINPSPCITGPIKMASGQAMRHRYRLVLHKVPFFGEQIQEHWECYVSEG